MTSTLSWESRIKRSNSSVDLIIWPEASIPGFFIKDNQYNRQVSYEMNTFLNRNKFLVTGLDLKDNDKKYNAAALFKNTNHKYVIFYQMSFFHPAKQIC